MKVGEAHASGRLAREPIDMPGRCGYKVSTVLGSGGLA